MPFGSHGGAPSNVPRCVRARGRPIGRRQIVERRVVAARQHGAAEVATTGEAVDPRDRVAVVVVAFEHARHAVVDVGGAFGVAHDARRLDRLQLRASRR